MTNEEVLQILVAHGLEEEFHIFSLLWMHPTAYCPLWGIQLEVRPKDNMQNLRTLQAEAPTQEQAVDRLISEILWPTPPARTQWERLLDDDCFGGNNDDR